METGRPSGLIRLKGFLVDPPDKGGKSESTPKVKPWSCARTSFYVKTPKLTRKANGQSVTKAHRHNDLIKCRQVASGMVRAPFIDISWKLDKDDHDRSPVRALVDTGADW